VSDFIFLRERIVEGMLAKLIAEIYYDEDIFVKEFHGSWGSLAVSENVYHGFQPYETANYITMVIGGPLLRFRDKQLSESSSETEGTRALVERTLSNKVKWDEDLSGPFVFLLINKQTGEVRCVTDLMSFIPVYVYQGQSNVILSTHVDILAKVANVPIDLVSQVDFILHGFVTYPYTTYKHIRQIQPASEHVLYRDSSRLYTFAYWIPEESNPYRSIREAAMALREALVEHMNLLKKDITNFAQFISGGEDSRVLSALLKDLERDAYIFLDQMNVEGKVARKTALKYGAKFHYATRGITHYIDILPMCADLAGSGSQFIHAHTYQFHRQFKLNSYDIVIGGFLSDSLLKGSHIQKIRGSKRIPFLPHIKSKRFSQEHPIRNKLFTKEVLQKLQKRRIRHLNYVRTFRKMSAEEWFDLWPSNMNLTMPNLHFNRRLFRSYEPFLDNKIVKISALIPQSWKMNRRVFQIAVKPLLKDTKWLLHSKGYLPYYPWYINVFVQFFVLSYRFALQKLGVLKGNQGPWNDWEAVQKSTKWDEVIEKYSNGLKAIEETLSIKEMDRLLDGLSKLQKVNLLQVLYHNDQALSKSKPK
jgi:asparagine synthetase B (glutamine-hydrolysing)